MSGGGVTAFLAEVEQRYEIAARLSPNVNPARSSREDVPRLLKAVRAGLARHKPVTTANGIEVCSRCSSAESRAVRSPCGEVQDITRALLGEEGR